MTSSAEEAVGRRTRVLVVSNLYPPATVGGYERECAEVVKFLQRDHEVRVLTSDRVRPAGRGFVEATLPFDDRPARARALAAPRALVGARAARRALAEFRPDVVWIWNGAQVPQAALRVLEEHGVPVLWRICEHWFGGLYVGDPFLRHLAPSASPLRTAPLRALSRLLNLHPDLRLDLARRVPAAISWNSDVLRRLTPLPPFVDARLERTIYPATSQAEALARIDRTPDDVPLVVFIGRLLPAKGTEIALDALAALRDRHRVVARLAFAGEVAPKAREELLERARRLRVDDALEFLGQLDLPALGALLGRAHVVVIPPMWQEPFGLVAVEAAFARVPVVAARSGGLVEILRDHDEAVFFDRGDSDGCADALHEALSDAPRTAARVEAAFERAQFFSLARYLRESKSFLDDGRRALS